MPTLAAIAGVTERIRLGTLVLNNDMRNPVQLAWEASTTTCNERWGISYFAVRELDDFEPVLQALR